MLVEHLHKHVRRYLALVEVGYNLIPPKRIIETALEF